MIVCSRYSDKDADKIIEEKAKLDILNSWLVARKMLYESTIGEGKDILYETVKNEFDKRRIEYLNSYNDVKEKYLDELNYQRKVNKSLLWE